MGGSGGVPEGLKGCRGAGDSLWVPGDRVVALWAYSTCQAPGKPGWGWGCFLGMPGTPGMPPEEIRPLSACAHLSLPEPGVTGKTGRKKQEGLFSSFPEVLQGPALPARLRMHCCAPQLVHLRIIYIHCLLDHARSGSLRPVLIPALRRLGQAHSSRFVLVGEGGRAAHSACCFHPHSAAASEDAPFPQH